MSFDRLRGFTLLEICLALAIGSLLILMAVPSISGMLAEQRLKESFERLNRMVAAAKQKSVAEQQTCTLRWEKDGITLNTGRNEPEPTRLNFLPGESFQLRRPAALQANPSPNWVFWSNGLCEPALVSYQGSAGTWLVSYDAMTARGTFLSSDVP